MRAIPGAALLVGLLLIGCTDKPVAPPPPQEKHPTARGPTCEDGMALVAGRDELHAVCIDRWEASLIDIFVDRHEEPHPPFEPVGSGPVRAVTRPGVMPQAVQALDVSIGNLTLRRWRSIE